MTIATARDEVGDPDALRRLERFGGIKLRQEMTTLFLQEAPARIASARDALRAGRLAEIRSLAHTLKSSAGQMGALRVQAICLRLEEPDQPQDLASTLSDLDEAMACYRSWLAVAFPTPASP